MSFYLLQGGTTLQLMTTSGTLTTLTLPTGITLDSSKVMRGTTLGNYTILVNSPNENIMVDVFGSVRVLCPKPPSSPPLLSTAASGTLSGVFQVKETFFVKDAVGNLIGETAFGPTSASSSTLANNFLVVNNIATSTQAISGRRLYRTTTGPGSTFFQWVDVDGNTVTSASDDLSDASLGLIAAPTDLGPPPRFDNIIAWKDRLWGRSPDSIDTLYQSGNGKIYAWPVSRTIPIPPANFDTRGITGFLPRRDELGVGKSTSLHKITGTNENNFTRVTQSEHIGVWAPDSCVVVRDIGYFLGNPYGIYTWGPQGVKCISNPKVRGWFFTDNYFNRSQFDQALGWFDPVLDTYNLLLSAVGSTALDRWIVYHIESDTWWGPHKTDAFTPTVASTVRDASEIEIPVICSSAGFVYRPQTTPTDGASTAIDLDITTNPLSADSPDIEKFWGEASIVSKIQASSPTPSLSITPTVGGLDATSGAVITHDMTKGRERLRRLGPGRFLTLRLRQNTNGVGTTLYGVEIPFHEIGRR